MTKDSQDSLNFFEKHRMEWRRRTSHLSNPTAIMEDASVKEIIGMGVQVVPLIVDQIEIMPDDVSWCWVLRKILGEGPTNYPLSEQAINAWLAFLVDRGYMKRESQ